MKPTTLDKLIDFHALSGVDFIKLDIEGAEKMTLEGSKRMLSEMKPVLCLEASDMPRFERISKYLAGYGYARFKFDRHGALHRVGEQLTEPVDNIFFLTDAHQKRFAEAIARSRVDAERSGTSPDGSSTPLRKPAIPAANWRVSPAFGLKRAGAAKNA